MTGLLGFSSFIVWAQIPWLLRFVSAVLTRSIEFIGIGSWKLILSWVAIVGMSSN